VAHHRGLAALRRGHGGGQGGGGWRTRGRRLGTRFTGAVRRGPAGAAARCPTSSGAWTGARVVPGAARGHPGGPAPLPPRLALGAPGRTPPLSTVATLIQHQWTVGFRTSGCQELRPFLGIWLFRAPGEDSELGLKLNTLNCRSECQSTLDDLLSATASLAVLNRIVTEYAVQYCTVTVLTKGGL